MALIKCPECCHEISDKATSCPNCGCPIVTQTTVADIKEVNAREQAEMSNTVKIVLKVALIVFIVILVIMFGLFCGGVVAGYFGYYKP